MECAFYKYHGTGNDFIIIDDRSLKFDYDEDSIAKICNRRFGVGADGLILLRNSEPCNFRMIYFNSDGKEGTMCGNGGRCVVAFAKFLGIIEEKAHFIAIDGEHQAEVLKSNEYDSTIKLKMQDVSDVDFSNEEFFINTGSPHHVKFVEDIKNVNVFDEGKKIRFGKNYKKIGGTNVNFVQKDNKNLIVRTYERGVEDETLSCGTGVTASALAAALKFNSENYFYIKTLGGDLKVSFKKSGNSFTNIWLEGPAKLVFKGGIIL